MLGSCRISSQRASFKPSLGGGYPPPRWITAYFLLDLDVRLHREVLLDQAVGAAVLRRLRDTVHVGKRAVVDEVAGVGRVITIAHRYAVIRLRGRQRTCRNRHVNVGNRNVHTVIDVMGVRRVGGGVMRVRGVGRGIGGRVVRVRRCDVVRVGDIRCVVRALAQVVAGGGGGGRRAAGGAGGGGGGAGGGGGGGGAAGGGGGAAGAGAGGRGGRAV